MDQNWTIQRKGRGALTTKIPVREIIDRLWIIYLLDYGYFLEDYTTHTMLKDYE